MAEIFNLISSYFLSPKELFDLIVMALALGYIFKDVFSTSRFQTNTNSYDPLAITAAKRGLGDFWFALMIITPTIFLHEMGHKYMALLLGYPATFHAPYLWLGIGVLMKLLNSPFIFIVGGYVTHAVTRYPIENLLISIAGPAVNLLLYFIASFFLRKQSAQKQLSPKTTLALVITKKINLFLFIFNMIPFPGFDGAHVLSSLIAML